MNDLKVYGTGRVADNEQALLVMMSRKPTDDELREIHDVLREHFNFDWSALQGLRKAVN
jgi:hypothetical protein